MPRPGRGWPQWAEPGRHHQTARRGRQTATPADTELDISRVVVIHESAILAARVSEHRSQCVTGRIVNPLPRVIGYADAHEGGNRRIDRPVRVELDSGRHKLL